MIYLVLALLIGGLVSGGLAWYYRSRVRQLEERAAVGEAAVDSLRSVNLELRASLERVLGAVRAQHEREARDDANRAAGAAGDPSAAAGLLNGLHQDSTGPGGRPGT